MLLFVKSCNCCKYACHLLFLIYGKSVFLEYVMCDLLSNCYFFKHWLYCKHQLICGKSNVLHNETCIYCIQVMYII